MPGLCHSIDALPPHAALAVGTFDGVHLGHQSIFRSMRDFAAFSTRPPCILTFLEHPATLLDPEHAPGLIQDETRLAHALRDDVSTLIFQHFDRAFADLSAEAFAGKLRGATIFCGEDWRFGKGAAGSPDFLRARGFDVRLIPYAEYAGERISSSRIRAAMAEGRMDAVAAMLGRPWDFYGKVVHGRGLAGPLFGVPTLNIPYRGANGERLAPLAFGVYRATVEMVSADGSGKTWPALINFGVAPSVKVASEPFFEVHLIGAEGDFYGLTAGIRMETPLLRPERTFASLDALKAQINVDLAACQEPQ